MDHARHLAWSAARACTERALDAPTPAWQAWLAKAIVLQAFDLNWKAAEEAYGARARSEWRGGRHERLVHRISRWLRPAPRSSGHPAAHGGPFRILQSDFP